MSFIHFSDYSRKRLWLLNFFWRYWSQPSLDGKYWKRYLQRSAIVFWNLVRKEFILIFRTFFKLESMKYRLAFGVPQMMISLVLVWIYLQIYYLPLPFKGVFFSKFKLSDEEQQAENAKNRRIEGVIRQKLDDLGPMSFAEILTTIIFFVMVLLWFFRYNDFIQKNTSRQIKKLLVFKGHQVFSPDGLMLSVDPQIQMLLQPF